MPPSCESVGLVAYNLLCKSGLYLWVAIHCVEEVMIMAKVNPIQLQKYLKGVDYPASKEDLLKRAKEEGADEEICTTLEQLPDEQYDTPADVSKAVGNMS